MLICIDLGGTLTMVDYLRWLLEGTMLIFTERTFACMKQAYDCGINFFDTAER